MAGTATEEIQAAEFEAKPDNELNDREDPEDNEELKD